MAPPLLVCGHRLVGVQMSVLAASTFMPTGSTGVAMLSGLVLRSAAVAIRHAARIRPGTACIGSSPIRRRRALWVRTYRTAVLRAATDAARKVAVIRCKTASAAIAPTAIIHKAVSAPAVTITPAGPWPHAEEDPIVEIS
jgi:hypothetical protein